MKTIKNLNQVQDYVFQHQAAFDSLPGTVFLKSVEEKCSRYLWANQSMLELMGYTKASEIIGMTDYDMRCEAASCAEQFIYYDRLVCREGNPINCFNLTNYAIKDITAMLVRKRRFTGINEDVSANIVLCSGIPFSKNEKYKTASDVHVVENRKQDKQEIRLSKREMDCLCYILHGRTAKEIGKILSISPRTVENHIHNVREKTGAKNKSQLFDYAVLHGLFYRIDPALTLSGHTPST